MAKTISSLRRLLLVIGGFAAAGTAQASSVSTVYVTQLQGTPETALIFSVSGARSVSGCPNAGFPYRWDVTLSTDRGKAIASLLMTAMSLHRPIDIVGSGTCTAWSGGDIEDVSWVNVN